ncbi:uncharacterized protein LOC122320725 [Drosophila ficusphila]|uniref:uncharacterized protein LOC122320725 n=1 Tax=Drosophila ficusphila TaxID=30025 RepID=UPI001C89F702|nr:uncharacterized protein LOC122320725 [Drosophila ficusphila]
MFLVLVVFEFISFTYSRETLSPCEDMFKKNKRGLESNFNCLMENYNLTETLSDVILKLDQVQQVLDKITSDEGEYKASPFKNIDDILDISSDISHKDCHEKRQIIRAIRRKLEWVNVMNGKDTTLFPSLWKSDLNKPEITRDKEISPEIQMRTEVSPFLDDVRCLLANAIRNSGNKLSF